MKPWKESILLEELDNEYRFLFEKTLGEIR